MILLSKKISLIQIKTSDQTKLFELMEKVYKSAYQHFWTDNGDWYLELCYSKRNLEKELSRERSHYYFVVFENKTVGILKYDFPFSPREIEIPNAMKLHRLYLDDSVHGNGLAGELMHFVETIAKKNELEYIWLEAMESKPQAKRFYEKCGFEIVYSYMLDFEKLKTEVKQIHILKKCIS